MADNISAPFAPHNSKPIRLKHARQYMESNEMNNITIPVMHLCCSALIMLGLLVPLSACHGKNDDDDAPKKASPVGTRLTLTISGYNYTNRSISDFSINGRGGGNLDVSDERNGGGKTTCCASHIVGANHRKVTIRWHSDSCYFRHKHREDESWELFNFYKEVEVPVKIDTAPGDPHYFEVHFYPDGRVEAAVMVEYSSPRLVLSDKRKDRSKYPKCPNDDKPNEG